MKQLCYIVFQLLIGICYIESYAVEGPPGMFTECLGPKVKAPNGYEYNQYSGTKSVTKSGKTCQRWNTDKYHEVYYKIKNREVYRLYMYSNYCRTLSSNDGYEPWCYTTDPKLSWEYCYIPHCTEEQIKEGREKYEEHENYLNTFTTCLGPKLGRYYAYRGNQSISKKGYTCARWDDMANDEIKYFSGDSYVSAQHNYCRSMAPDVVETPWCYTHDNPEKRWDYCDIKPCENVYIDGPVIEYVFVTKKVKNYIIDVDVTLRPNNETFELCEKRRQPGYFTTHLDDLAANPRAIDDIGRTLADKIGSKRKFYYLGTHQEFLNSVTTSTKKKILEKVVKQKTNDDVSNADSVLQCLVFQGSKLNYNPSECANKYGTVCIYERYSAP